MWVTESLTSFVRCIRRSTVLVNGLRIRCQLELKVSGKRVPNGKLHLLKTAPQKAEKIHLKVPVVMAEAGLEAFLNLRFFAAAAAGWCKSGHEVGWGQIAIPAKTVKIA